MATEAKCETPLASFNKVLANINANFMPDKYNSDRILIDRFCDDARGAKRTQKKGVLTCGSLLLFWQ